MSDWPLISPALVVMFGSLAFLLLRGWARLLPVLGLPAAVIALCWLQFGREGTRFWLDLELRSLNFDSLSCWFVVSFAIALGLAGLYALRRAGRVEMTSAYVYVGAALGAVLAGDLLSLFVFWEIMALASTMVIASAGLRVQGKRRAAVEASTLRYLLVHLVGGVLLMIGITGHWLDTGGLAFADLDAASTSGRWILAGVLVNAAVPPWWSWVADAYPRASSTGMVFLSVFTTKTAVYTLIRLFPGEPLLLWLGPIMAVYGFVYALTCNDARRLLAYSLVGQVGFMLTAIGIGTPLALAGATAHAFSHIMYKSALVMAAGSVLDRAGSARFSEVGGLGRALPVAALTAWVGGAAIAGLPLTAGFVSKSWLLDGVGAAGAFWPWLCLSAVAGVAALYVAVRLPWQLFHGAPRGEVTRKALPEQQLAMLLAALACVLPGLLPAVFAGALPLPPAEAVYTAGHVLGQLQMIAMAVLLVLWLLPRLPVGGSVLDVDLLWREGGAAVLGPLLRFGSRVANALGRFWQQMRQWLLGLLQAGYGQQSLPARDASVGFMGLCVLGLFAVLLWLYLSAQ